MVERQIGLDTLPMEAVREVWLRSLQEFKERHSLLGAVALKINASALKKGLPPPVLICPVETTGGAAALARKLIIDERLKACFSPIPPKKTLTLEALEISQFISNAFNRPR